MVKIFSFNVCPNSIKSKASSFLVLMKVYGSKIWNLYLYTSNRKYFKAKVEELINYLNYDDSKLGFQIFEPYTFIKTKNGEALLFILLLDNISCETFL